MKTTGKKVRNNIETTYYYCNRTGNFKSKGKGKCSMKSQGSEKIDSHCCANIILTRNMELNELKAKVNKAKVLKNISTCIYMCTIDIRMYM